MLVPVQTFPAPDERVPQSFHDLKQRRNNVHDFVYLNEIEAAVIDTADISAERNLLLFPD